MSEAAGVAGAGAAGGTGDGGAAAAAAGAAASGAGAAGNGAAAAGGAGALTNGAPPPVNHFAGVDADSIGWAQNKGLIPADIAKADLAKVLPELFKHGRNVESLIGKNRLPAPKDINDTEAYETIAKALGKPADVAGYEIALPEGGNKEYLDGMLKTFHEAHLTKTQAQAVAKASQELGGKIAADMQAANDAKFATTSTADLEAQRAEWGSKSDANFAAGQRAAQAFGIDQATMLKIEKAIGTKPMLGLFAAIGHGLTEDRGSGASGGGAGLATTVEQANATLKDLQADKAWIAKFQAGDAAAVAEYKRLTNVLASAA